MISTQEALAACLALAAPVGHEIVPLLHAGGRVLASTLTATRDQPPFATSVMDGYALDGARPGARYRVVGAAPAGHAWPGTLQPGEALRIFTGAPIPKGASQVVIQEDVTRSDDTITLADRLDAKANIRPPGTDFRIGSEIASGRVLSPALVALAAAMGHADLTVSRRPDVAIMATGDELVPPGGTPRPDQIVASNSYGLKAMADAAGANARLLPIAADRKDSLETAFGLARDADLVVTIGGASVGDHDIVGAVAADLGMARSFYKIAMRPGKPLMAGKLSASALLGLPGNPASAMVCGQIFMVPMIAAMLGLPAGPAPRKQARLAVDIGANGPREHYMRATLDGDALTPADSQDSALLTRLAAANVLLVRPPNAPACRAGDTVDYVPLIA
ncbi:MAG: molybdopterin molybdotransferase MoeA [Pseudomonadota bacterium]